MVKYRENILIITGLTLLCGWLFFFRLDCIGLTDPDEAFYAQTAKEMLSRDEWLTPYLFDKPQFEKPILFYWLVEASFRALGVNEFAARLPSAMLALAGVIALYLLGALLFNRRTGILSAVILATNVEYIMLSRACVTDMALSTFMLFGALFFFYGYVKKKGCFYLLSSAAFALATLTKGPVAIILPAAVLFVSLLFTRDLKALKSMPIIGCIAVFLVVTCPWYLLMYKMHGNSFLNAFFGFHNVTRFLESEHKIGSQFYYNVPIIFGGFFPWSAFLPVGLWRLFKKASGRETAGPEKKRYSVFILAWFFVIFIFFSVSRTKLPTYVFPSFISLALMTALFWDDFLKGDVKRGRTMGLSHNILFGVVVIGSILAPLYLRVEYPAISSGMFVSSFFLAFGMLLSRAAFAKGKFVWSFFLIVYAVAIFLYPLGKLVLPRLEPYETSKFISKKLSSLMKPGERLGSESNYLSGLAFYTDKMPTDLDKHHILVDFLSSVERVWFVLKEKNHIQIYTLDTKPFCKKPSYMVYKIGKRAIITNEIPDDGRYIIKRERLD